MTTEIRLTMAVDIDQLADRPRVTFDDRPGVEREVIVHIAEGDIALTFGSRFDFLGWLNLMARQYEERWGPVPPAVPLEHDLVEELGTPMAYGRGTKEAR